MMLTPGSEREILFLEQPYPNHNGGHLVFGPDGKLYAGFGDGGDRMDPHGNGQNRSALLAKMLRLDVDAGGGKGKPRPEIVMLGLRNPWRYSFDRKTGDLYIGDVGQDHWEEIDVVAAADVGKGKNFGWNVVEGMGHCARKKGCDQTGLVPPVAEYNHETGEGCSVTGGFVYRGKAIPELDGAYFYADYCTALIRSFRWKAGKIVDHWDWRPTLDPKEKLAKLASWGEDEGGELYLVSLDGTVLKLVRAK